MKITAKIGLVRYIKQRYISSPLNVQINIVIGLIILAAMISVMAFAYTKTQSQVKANFTESGHMILQETVDKVNSRLKIVENTILMISNDSRIINYSSVSKDTSEREINKYLNNCIDFNKYDIYQEGLAYIQNFVDDLIYINDRSTVVARRLHFTTYNINKGLDNPWFKKAYENKGKLIWTDHFYNSTSEKMLRNNLEEFSSRLNQFMLIRYMVNPQTSEDVGYIAASINLENLSTLIDNIKFGKRGNIYIIDEKGTVIASEDRTQLLKTINFDNNSISKLAVNSSISFEGFIGGEKYFIFSSPISINNWKLILTAPVKELDNSLSNSLFSVIIIGLLAFLLIIFVSALIINNVSNPLKKILVYIKETRNGNLNQRVDVKGCLEVNQLSTEFNFMLDKINELLNRIVDEQNALRKSELKAFRAQINPHFLYNTLDSIKWLIISGDGEKASRLIASLSTFFRIGLSGGREEIPVKDEFEHVKQYLSIQKIRCGDTMDYLIDIDSEVENCKTPKLILQPIVENAILHGLNRKEGHGFIKILGKRKDDSTIIYEVTDNGAGMTEEELERLNKLVTNPLIESTAGSHGYAMRNVNQRIKLSYGDEYGINYKSKLDVGTVVTVTIPVIE
ncbi:MAG: sensor histidine kinase [Clostridia bacterium]|nr:sensor histidine kinase [Clostridia bacterium]